MECVGEPDIRSADEAVGYLEALKRTFVELGVSDVKMEEGSLRCDANVSMRLRGATEFGTKAEIKNMNSFRSVLPRDRERDRAPDRRRSRAAAASIQETRGWDERPATRTRCARKNRRTTTATSPIPTSCRSRSTAR